jgi:hypothetical protein
MSVTEVPGWLDRNQASPKVCKIRWLRKYANTWAKNSFQIVGTMMRQLPTKSSTSGILPERKNQGAFHVQMTPDGQR